MASKFKNKENKDEKDDKSSNKVDTKYYDELFKRINDQDSEEFNDPDSLDILYSNILDQIKEDDKELKKCLNSFHIDFFIYKSSLEHFTTLFEVLTNDSNRLKELLNDTRTSRAYEACLLIIGGKVKGLNDQDKIDNLKKCLTTLGNYFVENFENIIETQNGIFAMRAFLRIIGHTDVLETQTNDLKNKKKFRNQQQEFNIKNVEVKQVPDEWKIQKFIKKFSNFIKEINILETGLIGAVSPFLSLLLRKLSTSYPDRSREISKVIHEQFKKKPNSFHSMIQDSIGSRFIESFLLTCTSDILAHYLEENLIPNIVSYTKHIYANYPIQTLIKHRSQTEEQVSTLFDSLVINLESIIDLHTDLIYKNYLLGEMINACHKNTNLDFKKFFKTLLEYFGCNDEENRVNFLRVLLVYENLEDIKKESLIDQALFVFDLKPIASTIAIKLIEMDEKTITKSFNSLNSNELEHLSTSPVGSHFMQQSLKIFYSKDRTVWLQSIYDKLKGRFLNISTNKSGSFVMETLWSVASFKQRHSIVEELKICENQLKNNQFSRYFVNNIGLNFYKRKPDEWKTIQTNELKKRKLFSDILGDSADSSSNNKNSENDNVQSNDRKKFKNK